MAESTRYSVDVGSNIRPDPDGMTPEEAGDQLISWAAQFALVSGDAFTDWELWALRATLDEVMSQPIEVGPELQRLAPHAISVIRRAINADLARGLPAIQARERLWMPVRVEKRYQVVYQTELPWMISGLMQLALMGNPAAGETTMWTSGVPTGGDSATWQGTRDSTSLNVVLPIVQPYSGLALACFLISILNVLLVATWASFALAAVVLTLAVSAIAVSRGTGFRWRSLAIAAIPISIVASVVTIVLVGIARA